MEKYIGLIAGSPLFEGVSETDVAAMLSCLHASVREYSKGSFILSRGEEVSAIGLMLVGEACIIKEDIWGNRNILAKISSGGLFAEAYACTPGMALGVSVVAQDNVKAMFLNVGRVMSTCTCACVYHSRLISNLLSVMAGKNLMLNEKLTHLTQRTTRSKLLSYLSAQAELQGTKSIAIPYNRQQLADYLSVDRSAMSAELGKMRDEGLLSFHRNSFTLYPSLHGHGMYI